MEAQNRDVSETSEGTGSAMNRALVALRDLRARLEAVESSQSEPIAVLGMGLRFPGGADAPEAFWQLLRDGVDAITEVPPSRWDVEAYFDPDPEVPGKICCRYGSFLEGIDRFDAELFGIAAREAEAMDPQQRLLLEVSWEALERAGQAPARLAGSRTGVFVGLGNNDYLRLCSADADLIDAYLGTGNSASVAAGRLSYLLDLQGPSLALDTACSSSLVAVHLACRSLRSKESDLALACGVNLILTPELSINFSKARMLAPDGRCKTFDARADGYVRGEGCAAVVLKRLGDAERDGDPILALIRGSAVNQDGRSSGLTAPNGPAQEAVIRDALAAAGVEPGQVGYVETHGTGTPLGDPIEVRSLSRVLSAGRPQTRPFAIGSVKTNVGHLEAAAGLAGLIKVVLALGHRQIPPHLHLEEKNPHVPWDEIPVDVPTELTPWAAVDGRRIAGVSSFGFSGTNAHVVVEEAPAPTAPGAPSERQRPRHLLCLSAATEGALKELARRFERHLGADRSLPLADVCYTANVGRSHFRHRLAAAAESPREMAAALEAFGAGRRPGGLEFFHREDPNPPEVAFLFTGQGSQYVGMGRELYDTQPTFRGVLERCDELLRPELDRSLLSVLYPGPGEESPLDETIYTQPALFALEVALAELWQSWGLEPAAVLGHSVGEYAAACVAGVFTLEEGLKLIAERARRMQELPPVGAMAAVAAASERVAEALEGCGEEVSIAAVNGPSETVISGSRERVRELCEVFESDGIRARQLKVSHAFHSPLMEPVLAPLERAAAAIEARAPQLDWISNLTGQCLAGGETCDASYWRRHAREPVRFATGMETLRQLGCKLLVEVGPQPTLLAMGRKCWPADAGVWLPTLRRGRGDWQQVLGTLAAVYVHGAKLDWEGFDRDDPRSKVLLPTYPFDRRRYWCATPSSAVREAAASGHPLLGQRLPSAVDEDLFESRLHPEMPPFLADHQIHGMVVFPAAAYLEMALAAARECSPLGSGSQALEAVSFTEVLTLAAGQARSLQLILRREGSEAASFRIFAAGTDGTQGPETWSLHASGRIPAAAAGEEPPSATLAEIRARCRRQIPAEEHYRRLRDDGLEYGPSFQGIECLWGGEGESLASIRLPAAETSEAGAYGLHPALLDACLQAFTVFVRPGEVYLPVAVESFRIWRSPADRDAGERLWAHARLGSELGSDAETLKGDLRVFAESGEPIAEARGVAFQRAGKEALGRALDRRLDEWLYELAWRPLPLTVDREPAETSGRWVVFSDRQGVGDRLVELLAEAAGERPLQIVADPEASGPDDGLLGIDPTRPEDFERIFAEIKAQDTVHGIVHLWSLDSTSEVEPTLSSLEQAQTLGCRSVLHLVQALVRTETLPARGLSLVTRGAQAVVPGAAGLQVAQAPLWGLGRVIAREHPELGCRTLDLAPDAGEDDAETLCRELRFADGEDQVAYRGGARHVARLVRARESPRAAADQRLQWNIPTRGVLENLVLQPVPRQPPGPGEVEIRVRAAGLNFRDVLNALGMYPGDAGALGGECSGEIVAVGRGVEDLAEGDAVLALASGGFSTFVTTPAALTVPKPDGLSFEEAATIPVAFLTADWALERLAGLSAGERVLIHAAAGGVGMAAVQLALRRKARVYATASPAKWDALRALGVEEVMNSRSLDFARQVMELTDGEGVDVVLNSLAEDFIPKSLSVLAPGGRFVEIGKRGIWDAEQVAEARSDVSYSVFDLAELSRSAPEQLRRRLGELLAEFGEAGLHPLRRSVFPWSEAIAAFRTMAQAKHVGKIVLRGPVVPPEIRGDGSYLITGGLGALGLQVARWLVERGARHLVLVSRRQAADAPQDALQQLADLGAQVAVVSGDVTRPQEVARIFAGIDAATPLRGVVHAAGVLDDGVLDNLDWERFAKVMAPKLAGAWNLHSSSRGQPLDFFVSFSSAASLLGSPGQGSYAAANAFLDALAHYRRSAGLPALAIDWGPWAENGMAQSRDRRTRARWRRRGMSPLQPRHGLAVLELLLRQETPQVAVLPVRWRRFVADLPASAEPPMLAEIVRRAESREVPAASRAPLERRLREAPSADRRQLLEAFVHEQAARVLGLDSTKILEPKRPLKELGIDSLMAVELRNALAAGLGESLPTTLVFDYPTPKALIDFLLGRLSAEDSPSPPAPVAAEQHLGEPIAILGMSCRFPGGADDPETFWKLLHDGVDAITEVPPERWDIEALYDPDPSAPGKMSTRYGGFLTDIDKFDATFFGIAPREAVSMDPQQRLLLELGWQALENAGQVPAELDGTATGVFVGISSNDYADYLLRHTDPERLDAYFGTGTAPSVAAGRLSYLLGLTGPCLAIDTACSSSLVAVHYACQSLRSGECELALVGGVNVILSPETTINFSTARMMAADGRCKTFDRAADGYVRGEGGGVLLLKRWSEALRDGDPVLAVIRGSAVNQDGRSQGLTAPNGPAQEAVIRAALTSGGVEPSQVSYVETHGTGTSLGDPIEVQALGNALGPGRSDGDRLAIGSVKTNVGHLEAAAGIAGLIKVVLALQHRQIPPHLHLRDPNPYIPWDDLPIEVATERRAWPPADGGRIAGVSAFSFSGTNAHLVLQEAPDAERVPPSMERPLHLLALSAASPRVLRSVAGRFADHLAEASGPPLADVCYSVNTGRSRFAHRLVAVAGSPAQMGARLSSFATGEKAASVVRGEVDPASAPQIAWLFSGQGSQYVGMGRQLYETQPTFRKVMERCDEVLRDRLEQPLLSVLYPEPGRDSPLAETAYAQPALFALEVAVAELWRSWGLVPAVVMGHSVGEFAAACVAGAFRLEDGLRLIAERGRLMQALPQTGEMAAVFASEDEVAERLTAHGSEISIAAVNGPRQTVISGTRRVVRKVLAELAADGIRSRTLEVSHAFHSPLMDPVLEPLEQAAGEIEVEPPRLAMISNLSGETLKAEELPDAAYWRRHARAPVRFAAGMEALWQSGCELLVEVGPQPTLLALGRKCWPRDAGVWLPTLRRGRDDWAQMSASAAELYVRGVELDWRGFDSDYDRRKVALPSCPFERRSFWVERSDRRPADRRPAVTPKPEQGPSSPLGRRIESPFFEGTLFELRPSTRSSPFLDDHRLYGRIVMPAAGHLAMVLAAAEQVSGHQPRVLDKVTFPQALVLADGEERTVQLILAPQASAGEASFQVLSRAAEAPPQADWTTHAHGGLRPMTPVTAPPTVPEEIQLRCSVGPPVEDFYQAVAEAGLSLGPGFRWMEQIWRGENEVLARMRPPRDEVEKIGFPVFPGLIDSCFQLVGSALSSAAADSGIYVPIAIERFVLHRRPSGSGLWCHVQLPPGEGRGREILSADFRLLESDGNLVAAAEKVELKRAPRQALLEPARPGDAARRLYELRWRPQARQAGAQEDAPEPGRWLIAADRGGIGERLAELLEARGESCALVFPATAGEEPEPGRWMIEPGDPAAFARVLSAAGQEDTSQWRGVVHLWSLEAGVEDGELTAESLLAGLQLSCASVLHLLQAVMAAGDRCRPRLWLITRGAQAAAARRSIALEQAPLWGLGRVMFREHPELGGGLVDLGGGPPQEEAATLLEEIWAPDGEDQLAFRDGVRHVARLVPKSEGELPVPTDRPYRLAVSKPGLENLTLEPAARSAPGVGEVEIQVRATGLNFRDVLNAMGLYPGDAGPLGGECAGEIVALGPGVEDLAVGDPVLAMAPGSFSTWVTVPAALVAAKPPSLCFEQAATIPIAFLTASGCLHQLAGMKSGDRVLIHSAAGGVGMAAVQLAQRCGAEVFATASPGKWPVLEALGVEHVMSSRNLEFAAQVMHRTGGRGVDVVLNSLTEEFIPASLEVLVAEGRFVEIGKRGIWAPEQVAQKRRDVSYFIFDLAEKVEREPERIGSELRELAADLERGSLRPLPREVFPVPEVARAFRHMARAQHTGKIVVTHADPASAPEVVLGDRTYLITGGLGSLGLQVARWMVERGARHLLLVGRRGASEVAAKAVAEMEAAGAEIVLAQADVSQREEIAAVLARSRESMPPLAGVVHAAGVLDDGALMRQDWPRFAAVLAPKVAGAFNLHALTSDAPLDFLVLFSSMASLLGPPGQASYAAANAFLDALAHHRQNRRLPALSLSWGPWAEAGMAAGDGWGATGARPLAPRQGLESLERLLLRTRVAQGGIYGGAVHLGVIEADWAKYLESLGTAGRPPPLLSGLAREPQPRHGSASAEEDKVLERLEAAPPGRRLDLLADYVRELASEVMELESPQRLLGTGQGFFELGMDSLMALELRSRLEHGLKLVLAPPVIFDYPEIESLARHLAGRLALDAGEAPSEAPSGDAAEARLLAEVRQSSEDDLEAFISDEVSRWTGEDRA
ncbi:MAG: SDR family NAD(P)-dependent oxidoreductase [Thermoanaerobaculia bacterium]